MCASRSAEASEAIADDGAGGIEAAPGQLFHLLAPEAVDPAQLQAHRLALGRTGGGGNGTSPVVCLEGHPRAVATSLRVATGACTSART